MDKKDDFKKYWNIFPKGNPERAYFEAIYHTKTQHTFFGDKVTWYLIMTKWEQYIKKCREDDVEEKYIKTMESFIKSKDYQNEYDLSPKKKMDFIDRLKTTPPKDDEYAG